MNPLKMAPSDSTAMCLYIPLALPLALSSSSDSFVCSYPLASQSTLNCPQPSLSFNLSSTPLLFVPPLSTSQLSSIFQSRRPFDKDGVLWTLISPPLLSFPLAKMPKAFDKTKNRGTGFRFRCCITLVGFCNKKRCPVLDMMVRFGSMPNCK
jgi:hypothetical protein